MNETDVVSDHWNAVYASRGDHELSWFEAQASTSLELFDLLGVTGEDSVLDVGGGRSALADSLRERGHRDVSVLDLSGTALEALRSRWGPETLTTIEAEVTAWRPTRRYDVWHHRAALHFIPADRVASYVARLREALQGDGAVVLGVFAPDGPTSCSGLPVIRYGAEELVALLGHGFSLVDERRRVHVTPAGVAQSFQWIAARRHVEA